MQARKGPEVVAVASDASQPRAELFLEGLLASIALGTLSNGTIDVATGVMVAAVVVLGWIAGPLSNVASAGFGLLGVVAAVPVLVDYFAGDACMLGVSAGWRIALFVAVAVMFGWGAMHTLFLGRNLRAAGQLGLGWFALMELLTFFSMTAVLTRYSIGLAVLLAGVVTMGALVGFRPKIGIWAVGVGMALITLAGSTYVGVTSEEALGCLALGNATGSAFSYLLAFIPVGMAVFLFVKFFRR